MKPLNAYVCLIIASMRLSSIYSATVATTLLNEGTGVSIFPNLILCYQLLVKILCWSCLSVCDPFKKYLFDRLDL